MRSHEGCGEMRLLGPSTQEYTHRRIQGLVRVWGLGFRVLGCSDWRTKVRKYN